MKPLARCASVIRKNVIVLTAAVLPIFVQAAEAQEAKKIYRVGYMSPRNAIGRNEAAFRAEQPTIFELVINLKRPNKSDLRSHRMCWRGRIG